MAAAAEVEVEAEAGPLSLAEEEAEAVLGPLSSVGAEVEARVLVAGAGPVSALRPPRFAAWREPPSQQ